LDSLEITKAYLLYNLPQSPTNLSLQVLSFLILALLQFQYWEIIGSEKSLPNVARKSQDFPLVYSVGFNLDI
jgi:hypothetical protein